MNSVSLHSYDTTTGTRHDHHQPERSSVDREQPAFVSSGSRNMFHQRPPLCCWLLFSDSRSLFPNHLWKPIVTRLGTLDAAEESKVWYVRAPAMSNWIPKKSTAARRYFLPRRNKRRKIFAYTEKPKNRYPPAKERQLFFKYYFPKDSHTRVRCRRVPCRAFTDQAPPHSAPNSWV